MALLSIPSESSPPYTQKQRVQANQLTRNNRGNEQPAPKSSAKGPRQLFLVTAPGKDRFAAVLILSILVPSAETPN
jgi:hypothetical protein